MKYILVAILLVIIGLFFLRIIRTFFVARKVFKDALSQQNHINKSSNQPQKPVSDKPKFNIEAETIDYEIIDDKDEK